MSLPFTRQEVTALVLLGTTGLVGMTLLLGSPETFWGSQAASRGSRPPPAQASAAAVNVNTASVEELVALPGLGDALARRIVEHRRRHGRFLRVADLARVKGISPALATRLASRLTVE